MNEYFQILQDVNQSIEQLLTENSHSINLVEIQKSAQNLQQSVRPCLEEIKLSVTKIKDLMQVCFQDLDRAEDVWQSKPRIAEVSQKEICEQLGELTECHVKINQLGEQYKIEATKLAQYLLDRTFEEIRKQYFMDPKTKQQYQAIGWGDKDAFNGGIRAKLQSYSEQLDAIIIQKLFLLHKTLKLIPISFLYNHINLFDGLHNKLLEEQLIDLIEELQVYLTEDINTLERIQNGLTKNIFSSCIFDLDNLRTKSGDIYWQEVIEFKNKVLKKSQKRINIILDDYIALLKETLELGIQFYNDLLEKQNRYQQESPEQYLSEKAWIDQQRHELTQILMQIEKIIN